MHSGPSDALVRALVDLIRLPSQNPGNGEGEVAAYVAERCRRLGLEVDVTEALPGRPNVVAWLRGRQRRPAVALNTHLDTVPISDGWTVDPFAGEVRDGRVWGIGAGDAKGQIVAMLGAIAALVAAGAPLRGDLVFTAVADEEMGSEGARAVVKGLAVDHAVIGEPTRLRVGIAHRGSLRPRIVARGRSAHSSTPRLGVNAIYKMRTVLAALEAYCEGLEERTHPLIGSPSGAVTLITGGHKESAVPDRCEIVLDRRMVPGERQAEVVADLEALLARLRDEDPELKVAIEGYLPTSGPPSETPRDARLVALAVDAVGEVTGRPGEVYGAGFGCDMTHFRAIGADAVILGPGDIDRAHKADEYIELRELEAGRQVYLALLRRLLGGPAMADDAGHARAVRAATAPAVRAWDPALAWFTLVYGLLNFGQGVFPPLLPEIMDGLGLRFATVGLLGSAFGLARFVTDLPAGLVVDRRGALSTLHGGIGCLLGGTLLSAWAPALPLMLVARAIVGVGSGLTIVVSILFVMRRGPAASRTRRGNVYEIGVIGGTALSAWLGGHAAASLGWRSGFGLAALAIAVAWGLTILRLGPAFRELHRPAPSTGAAGVRGASLTWGAGLAIYLATFTLAVAWAGGIGTFLPLYGGRGLALSADVLGRALSIAYLIEAALLVPVGWAADALGRVRVLVAGFGAMLAGVLLVPATTGAVSFGAAATLLVCGLATWMVPPVLLTERLPGGFRGPAAGLYRLVSDFAYIIAPGAVGWLIGRHGFRAAGLSLVSLLVVATGVAIGALGRPPRDA